jgi:hypothetical protein
MLKFREDLLQFIWKNRLLKPGPLLSKGGKTIEVLQIGEHNKNAGPDFFNSQVRVDGVHLAGNVELHIRTSDWLRHFHQHDKSYDKLILHVVYEHDVELEQNTTHGVEVLEVKDLLPEETLQYYERLIESQEQLPCKAHLKNIPEGIFEDWIKVMSSARLEELVERIRKVFTGCGNDYVQTFYSLLLRNFGFKVNSVPFELLSRALPFQLLLKHRDQLLQVEALLLGMSGLLEEQAGEPYIRKLQNEFEYLKAKYHLIPLESRIFKFSQSRPANFPTLRLAQFAQLIHHHPSTLVSPQQFSSFEEIKKGLQIATEGYWEVHYPIGGDAAGKALRLGGQSIQNLIINSFAPFLFFYGKQLRQEKYCEFARELLKHCRKEENYKTRLYDARRPQLKDASHSQGLIHLYDQYCSQKKCLHCGIGAAILSA